MSSASGGFAPGPHWGQSPPDPQSRLALVMNAPTFQTVGTPLGSRNFQDK
jgi:hypothetical protein